MGQTTPPASVADFKVQFSRDFHYGVGLDTVRDIDIQAGLNMASTVYNPALFDTTSVGVIPNLTSEALMAYLYASAHFMVLSLQAAGGLSAVSKYQGVNSQGEGIVSGKGVGGVNVSFSWPSTIVDNPALFQFTKTSYGQSYLQILMLKLVGNVQVVAGETQPEQNNPTDV